MDDSLGSASKRSKEVRRKVIEKRSDVWDHYVPSDTPPNRKATCIHCDKVHNAEHGTSQLKRHLQSKHPDKYPCSSETNSVDTFYYQENSRKLLIQLVTQGGMPLDIVDNQIFLNWLRSLQPMHNPDKMENLRIHIIEYFTKEKSRLKPILSKVPYIHLTFHTRKSRRHKYLAITACHMNDDFEVMHVMLGFKQLPSDYTPIHLKSVVDKCLNDWRIGKNILLCTTSKHVQKDLKVALHPLFDKVLFVQCCSDVINGMVRDCLSAISKPIKSIRRIVGSWNLKHNNKEFLHQGALGTNSFPENSIPLDDVSQWDSTLYMLRAALEYKEKLDYYASDYLLKEYSDFDKLFADDWRRVSSVVKYMETFHDAMNTFSNCRASPNLYLQTFLGILEVISDKNTRCDETLNNLCIGMERKFRDYLSHNYRLLSVASVLDPSSKMYYVQFFCNDLFKKDSNVKIEKFAEALQNMFNSYSEQANKNHTAHQVHEDYNTEEANVANSGKRNVEQRFYQFKKQKMNNSTRSELDTYLQEAAVDDNNNFNVPHWWKGNSYRYPVLSRMARAFLAAKVLALPLEHAFCMDGQFVDSVDDAAMNPEIVEAVMCCKHWEKSSFDDNLSSQCLSNSSVMMVE